MFPSPAVYRLCLFGIYNAYPEHNKQENWERRCLCVSWMCGCAQDMQRKVEGRYMCRPRDATANQCRKCRMYGAALKGAMLHKHPATVVLLVFCSAYNGLPCWRYCVVIDVLNLVYGSSCCLQCHARGIQVKEKIAAASGIETLSIGQHMQNSKQKSMAQALQCICAVHCCKVAHSQHVCQM